MKVFYILLALLGVLLALLLATLLAAHHLTISVNEITSLPWESELNTTLP